MANAKKTSIIEATLKKLSTEIRPHQVGHQSDNLIDKDEYDLIT